MVHDLQQLLGHALAASDGDIGRVKDFYFDDRRWVIRYLVADTGVWLSGRAVLLSPHAFGHWDRDGKTLAIHLTRKQVEDSPSIESHQPVSRQYEIEYYDYYGWPAYWTGDAIWGLGGFPVVMPPATGAMVEHTPSPPDGDAHLQSVQAVKGYQIHATDGALGTVSGFRVDDRSWAIVALAVETGHWFSGREVLVASARISRISHVDSSVFVNLTKADLRRTADHDVATPGGPGEDNFSVRA